MSKPGVHQLVNISEIELDIENPRIYRFLANYSEKTPEAIHMALGAGGDASGDAGTTFISLRETIRTNGGIISPIIVNRRPDGSLVVIEGNTRLAIYQSFHADGSSGDWSKIPSIIYDNLPQEKIDAIRLQAHLVGPRAWDPYSKARYLHHLRNFEQMDFNRLADYCGGRKREVQKFISAYTDMEQFYRPVVGDADFDPKKFSSFVEMQMPASRKEALQRAGYTMTDFSRWIYDDLFDKQEDVRDLDRILSNPKARATFLKEGSRKAKLLLDSVAISTDLSGVGLAAICQAFIQKLSQITLRENEALKADPDGEIPRLLREAEAEVKMQLRYIDSDADQ